VIRIFPKGTGSNLTGCFCFPVESFVAASFGVFAVFFAFYQIWKADKSGGELAVVLGMVLGLSAVIIYFERRRGLRDEPIVLKFLEETLDARVIVS
jgi:hypothetical protein